MASGGYLASIAKNSGSGYPLCYRKGIQCILRALLGSYQLVKHYSLVFWKCWTPHDSKKMEVLTCYFSKPQCSYKQASISCFVNQGLHVISASVIMILFEPMCHDCNPRYSKPTILAVLGTPRLAQNGQFGVLCYYS